MSGTLNETRFVLRDYLDPVAILTAAGVVDERYGYEAFGPVRVMDANFATRSSSTCAWNWLYHGEFLDGESGMYDYGYRFYHPALGRWASRDPIGEEGGLNLYGFVDNDGVNYWDVNGLRKDPSCVTICLGIAAAKSAAALLVLRVWVAGCALLPPPVSWACAGSALLAFAAAQILFAKQLADCIDNCPDLPPVDFVCNDDDDGYEGYSGGV